MHSIRLLIPSLVLALGILGTTFMSVANSTSIAWVLTAAALLSATIIGAGALGRRLGVGTWIGWLPSVIIGLIFFLAAGIVALKDPSRVPSVLPLLGASAAIFLIPNGRGCKTCRAKSPAAGEALP